MAECDVCTFQIIAEACGVGAILHRNLTTEANAKAYPPSGSKRSLIVSLQVAYAGV